MWCRTFRRQTYLLPDSLYQFAYLCKILPTPSPEGIYAVIRGGGTYCPGELYNVRGDLFCLKLSSNMFRDTFAALKHVIEALEEKFFESFYSPPPDNRIGYGNLCGYPGGGVNIFKIFFVFEQCF